MSQNYHLKNLPSSVQLGLTGYTLEAAVERSDFTVMQRLLAALATPYEDSPHNKDYRTPPESSDHPYRTFCGT